MLLLVYALVKAPGQGWGATSTIAELAAAAVVLTVFVLTELRRRNPLLPFSIFNIKGLAAADATQMIAFAGFVSLFFFLTLYMQNVLGYFAENPERIGLPAGPRRHRGRCRNLIPAVRSHRHPAGHRRRRADRRRRDLLPLARPGSRLLPDRDLLPGLVVMSIGLGAVFVAVTAAANAGVPADKAGLAAGLLNTSQQLGTALGLAVFAAIATARTSALLAAHAPRADALTAGFHQALLACAIFLLAAAGIALRAANTHGEPVTQPSGTPAARDQVPAAERPADPRPRDRQAEPQP